MSDVPPAPDDPAGSITMLYQQWRRGSSESLDQLISRFWPRLLALANSTLRGRVQRVADAEDALQSAMVSFWQGVAQGEINNNMDREDLWNVLGLITVRKAIKLQERERTQKRGGGQVVTGIALEQTPGSSPVEGMDLICEDLLKLLDPELRAFALLRLMGHKNREIAEELGCTERKVERKLNLIRAEWQNEVGLWNA